MRELTIYRLYFTEADCYRKGIRQTPRGVQVHSTGANNPWLRRYVGPDDGRLGKNPNNNTHNRPGGTVCANAYIGKLQDGTVAIYQALPWDMRCWLSGSGANGNANRMGYVGFEICEDGLEDEAYFREAMDKAALLTAALCLEYGFTPHCSNNITGAGSVRAVEDHAGLHSAGLASNHGDIGIWLKKFGYTMQDFRKWAAEAYVEGVNVTYINAEEKTMIDHPTLKQGDKGDAVTYLQTLLGDVGESIAADGIFGEKTKKAVEDFQRLYKLTIDGVVGSKTWAALEKATGHQDTGETGTSEQEERQTITILKSDWDTLRASYAAAAGIFRKYESVG